MEILTPKDREALSKYPLYSQDGKQGEAVAVVRLFITGTAATYYITEANLTTGELFGVSNLEREGFRYGYFYLPELEDLNLYGGTVHVEALDDTAAACNTDCLAYARGTCKYSPNNRNNCPRYREIYPDRVGRK